MWESLKQRLRTLWAAMRAEPSTRMLVLGFAAGLVGGLCATGFDLALEGVRLLSLGAADASLSWWQTLLAPAVGGLLAGGLLHLSGVTRPAGMSRLVEAVQLHGGALPLRDGLATALSAALALGTGHSGGREAPAASLSAAVTHTLGVALGLRPAQLRVLAAAAAAAAISASFNTPLGSAVLALEVILGSFTLQHMGPVIAATVTGTLVGQALLGDRVAFHAPPFSLDHTAELLAYAGLGLVCAVVAAGYQAAVHGLDQESDRTGVPAPLRGAAAGLVVGGLAAAGLGGIMGTGYPLVDGLLADPGSIAWPLLLALLVGKVVATAVTFAGRTGVGLFSPLLVTGALTGLLFGQLMGATFPGASSPGSYGLVAMGALAAAVLRAPLSMTLILFELSGTYAVVPTAMITIAVASLVSAVLRPESLYDELLAARGVRLHREVPAALRALPVQALMHTNHRTVPVEHSLDSLIAAFHKTRESLVWVIDDERHYRGVIDVQEVLDRLATGRTDTAELTRDLPLLHPNTPVGDAIELLSRLEEEEAPVVDEHGVLVGVLHERALLSALELSAPRA